MFRLPDNCFSVRLPDGGTAIRGFTTMNVADDERAAVLALARGARERPTTTAPVVESDDPDAVAMARLAALGRGFSWHLEGLEGASDLVAELRRVAARARAFGSLASLPLLPESAAGIALRLSRSLDDKEEVLVHGGQLLVGIALALRGRSVTVFSDDDAARDITEALAQEGLPVAARKAHVLSALDEDLCGRFALVLVDTLAAPGLERVLLSRALAATRDGGRVVALVHSMRRPLTRRLLAELPVVVEEPLHEVAVRLHPGFAPAEFSWDEWVLRPTGTPSLRAEDAVSAQSARGTDPTEQVHGCVEVQGLDPDGLSGEALDRAITLFASALDEPPLHVGKHDEERHLLRYLALPAGGQVALSVDKEAGIAAVDLFPWSPFLLALLVGALLVELPRVNEEELL